MTFTSFPGPAIFWRQIIGPPFLFWHDAIQLWPQNELSFCRWECCLSLLTTDGLDHSKSSVSMRNGKPGAQDKLGLNVALCFRVAGIPSFWRLILPTQLIKMAREIKQERLFPCTVLASHGEYSARTCRAGIRFSYTVSYFLHICFFSQRFLLLLHFSRQWSGAPLGEDCEGSWQMTGRNIQWCHPTWCLVYNWAYCMAGVPIILSFMNRPEKQFCLSTHHLSFLKSEFAEKILVFTAWILYTVWSVLCVLRYRTHRSCRQISMISILFC